MSDLLCLEELSTQFLGIASVCFSHIRVFTNYVLLQRVCNCHLKPLSLFERAPSFFLCLVSLKRRRLHLSMAVLNTMDGVFLLVGTKKSQKKVDHLKHFPHGCRVPPFSRKIIGYHGNSSHSIPF